MNKNNLTEFDVKCNAIKSMIKMSLELPREYLDCIDEDLFKENFYEISKVVENFPKLDQCRFQKIYPKLEEYKNQLLAVAIKIAPKYFK